MRGIRLTLGLMGIFALAGTANAEEGDAGIYLGGGVGMYDVKIDGVFQSTTFGNANFNDSGTVWRGFGGYAFNKYIAIQGDYQDYGNTTDIVPPGTRNRFNVDGEAWEASVRLSYPLTHMLEIYGRAGWNWYEVHVDPVQRFGQPQARNINNNDDAFMGSGGLALHFTPSFSAQAEYEAVNVNNGDLSHWTVNFVYKFGR
jgi:OmpA-OmpF porin, OOP family